MAGLEVSIHHGFHNKTAIGGFEVAEREPWISATLTPLELAEHISSGKAWIACRLKGPRRCEENAGAWNLIALDIDGDLTLEQFWASPFAARHCAFTYTSPSHRKPTDKNPEALDRFRAIFPVGTTLEDIEVHRQLYALIVERCGFCLKDNCGDKPERLWYGYDGTEIRYGGATPLDWDLVELAKDEAAAEIKRQEERAAASGPITDVDVARAEYLLRHVLEPSGLKGDGTDGYEDCWLPVMQAAASAGDALYAAFMDWSSRGGHHKAEARRLQRGSRWARSGHRSGVAKLFALAKEQKGPRWQELLPEELRSMPAVKPPLNILKRDASASLEPPNHSWQPPRPSAPEPVVIPDTAPTTEQLRKLPAGERLIARRPQTEDAHPGATSLPKPPGDTPDLGDLLEQLYALRAHGLIRSGDSFSPASAEQIAKLDRQLLSRLLEFKGYCNTPSEVERDLLSCFRKEHGMMIDPFIGPAQVILDGITGPSASFLIPGFILERREHVIHAKAGTGKTIFAIHMTRALVGDPIITEFLDSGPLNNMHRWKKSRVLFIASDMGTAAEEMTNTYIERFELAGLPFLQQVDWWLAREQDNHQAWRLTLRDLVRLDRHLESMKHQGTPVSAVIIDSMKSVCPDHILVGQQVFKNYLDLVSDICSRHDAALIWIHHTRGDGGGAQGIQRISEGASVVIRLDKSAEDRKRTILKVEKIRGGAIARDLIIDPFALGQPDLIQGDPDAGGGDDRVDSVLRVIAEDQGAFLLANPGVDPTQMHFRYPGLTRQQILERLGPGSRISERTLRRLLPDLAEKEQLRRGGQSRATTYQIPSFQAPGHGETGDLFTDLDD